MNATTLHKSEIGNGSIIAAGAVVTEGQRIPDNSFVVGIPARVKGEVRHQMAWLEGHEHAYPDLAKRYKEQGL